MNGIELIAAERQRQIEVEGWTADSDDAKNPNEMPAAAACYALHVSQRQWVLDPRYSDGMDPSGQYSEGETPDYWPWANSWWKPKGPLKDLVRAGALIAAAIDRRLRQDWKAAYIAQMVSRGVPPEDATDNYAAGDHHYSQDPAEAADEEMSYWADDGGEDDNA